MFVTFLLYLGHYIFFNRAVEVYVFYDSIYLFASLSVYPLFFLYILSLTEKLTSRYWFFVLLPPFLIALITVILDLLMSSEESIAFIRRELYQEKGIYIFSRLGEMRRVVFELSKGVFLLQILFVVYWGTRRIIQYDKMVKDYYSNIEGKTLSSIRILLVVFVVTSLCSISVKLIGRSYFIQSELVLAFPSLVFGSLLYLLGFFGSKQMFSAQDFAEELVTADLKETTPPDEICDEKHFAEIKDRLLDLLENKEYYRQKDLRLSDISMLLGTNRSYISRVVNQRLHTSFCDLVNKYRIEHAKKMMRQSGKSALPLEEIAEASGFSGESSFYRVFKKKNGMSPGSWREANV
ncbi:MAG: AraC family transcriptional regulator [Bacteroidales bacterium]|nr:AraC family transcriptional regulator [Bacteroidales bacterium]